jgi:hypothetical protein
VSEYSNIDLSCPYLACTKHPYKQCEECRLDDEINKRILYEKLAVAEDSSSSTDTLT